MKTALRIVLSSAVVLVSLGPLAAEDVDENALFSGDKPVVESKSYEKKDLDADQNEKRIGFSGQLTSIYSYSATRQYFQGKGSDGNVFGPSIEGTGYLDARLPGADKGFGAFDAVYDCDREKTTYAMPELFVDFNIAKRVYFRTGKQVVQWGRCYLWNPTDLINVEKKSFTDKIGPREGTSGVKVHVPFGTALNLYGFACTVKTKGKAENIAGTGKAEFLVGGTEMAFSVWGANAYNTVGAWDFSTRLLTVDIKGEASVSDGSNDDKVGVRDGVLTKYRDDSFTTKACLDLGRAFDALDQTGKIQVNLEGFYNGSGYRKNVFRDRNVYAYDKPITMTVDDEPKTIPGGSKAVYLAGNELYSLNYMSRWYAAAFVTVNDFFTSSMKLTVNVVGNIEQKCCMSSVLLSYETLQGFKASAMVNGYFGEKDTEYTWRYDRISGADLRLAAGIVF